MKLIKTIDEQGVMYSLSGEDLPENYVLSLKNCEAIERDYDLDELAYDYSWNHQSDPKWGGTIDIFKDGFQKALQLLGDKKFSEKNLDDAISWATINGRKGDITHFAIDEFIQSLQQNEWRVEIVEEEPLVAKARQIHGEYVASKLIESTVFPKPLFDADGCLILKRK